jgi:hypothetical protein
MRWYRFLPYVLTGVAVFLLAGALRGPGLRLPAAAEPAPAAPAGLGEARSDPEAAALVGRALARLEAPERAWLQTAVWLRSHLPGLSYQGEGVYLSAPGRRYRLEVRTRGEGGRAAGSTLLAVSDGHDRWQAGRTAAGDYRGVQRLPLDAPPDPRLPLCGPGALLRSLHEHLVWTRREAQGGDVVVMGAWHPYLRDLLAPAAEGWPAALPRACRLWLSGPELWPARLEWWGPAEAGGADRLLAEMEFREPSWGRPLPEEECRRLFAFDPAGAAVEDLVPLAPPAPAR